MSDMTDHIRKPRLLVVDDSAETRELLDRHLSSQGYSVLTAADVAQALRILGSTKVDLVITDLKLPGVSGLDLVRHVRENLKDTAIMMITGYPSVESAVAAVKSGAQEYLTKPFTKEELLGTVRRVVEGLNLRAADLAHRDLIPGFPLELVGESEPMVKLVQAIARVAGMSTPVLITGEYGTGKGLVARFIHRLGPRAEAPFVPVLCNGLPEEFVERLLFGWAGQPGGSGSRAGLFEFAQGGTVYFREISVLPRGVQERLALTLREKRYTPAGDDQPRAADFQVIADTQKDLGALTAKGAFLDDLYVRLSLNNVRVPSLRERGNDVILLARHFLRESSSELGKPAPVLTDRAIDAIKAHTWPGNVGELENVARQLVATSDASVIDVADLPASMRYSAIGEVNISRSLADVEVDHIRSVIASVGGNRTRAAEILGINRKTLREKLKQAKPSQSG